MKIILPFILILTSLSLVVPSPVSGQKTGLSVEQAKQMHHETMDDPYLPNAWQNKKTSPAYQFTISPKTKSVTTTVFTTQVNVNAGGQNIVGDAGNEPSIAVNPLNPLEMVIGWRQFDNVASNFRQAGWAYSTDGGRTWTFPGVIEPGIFRSDPVLDIDADGNFYYNSLTNFPDYFCKVFRSHTGGSAWDEGTAAGGGDKQWMVIDRTTDIGRGFIYSTWSLFFSTCNPGFFTRSADGGDHYENCIIVDGAPYWCTMAVGNSGELFIGGACGKPDSLVVAKSVNARERDSLIVWDAPAYVYMDGNPGGWGNVNPVGLNGQVNIDVDHSDGPGKGNVYLLASLTRTSNGDPCDVMFSRSTNGGLTWSAPLRINDDESAKNTQWFGTMSVAPTGRIDVIWLDTRDAPAGTDSSALYYSFSTDQGVTWSANEKLSTSFDPHVGYPNQNKLGDYLDMVSDSTGAHLAWANTFNGEQDVNYSHIIPPLATGTDEKVLSSKIRIFPNPGSGIFELIGLPANSHLEIFNALGEKILDQKITAASQSINLKTHPSGSYYLKIISQDGSTVIKNIIKK